MISPVTVSDVLHDLRQRQLNKEELVSCLRWWIGLKQDSSAINLAQLLEVSVFSNADGSILPLSSVRYFVDPQTLGGRIPQDSPLANSLLPQDIAKQFTPAELSSFGWQEFTVDDDDALLEIELPPSTSAALFNYDEPPSPASRKKSLQSGAPPPGSSSPGPPIIPSVEMPDPKPTSDDPASSEGNRRIIREWFRKVMTKRSHNRTPRRTPSDASPQPGIPSKTKAAPQNEKPSTMSPGKRSARTVAKSTVRPQKKSTPKPPVSCQPPKTAPRSEAGSADVPDETKAGPSGAQNDVEREVGGLSSYNVNVSLSFSMSIPSWICCGRVNNNGGTH